MTTVSDTIRLTPDELRARVATIPRIGGFALTPTPLEELTRLSAELDGPRIFAKRDDLTGFAFGGNKVRAVEFRMADLKAKGCDTLVLVNVGQSNHARLHAAACQRLGLKMVLIKPGPKDEAVQGNLLLIRMLGVEVVEVEDVTAATLERVLEETLEGLRSRGHRPYVHTRDEFSPLAGTVGYTDASAELLEQARARGIEIDHLFLVAGSSAAGLALGGKLLGARWRVHPISVTTDRAQTLHRELYLGNGVASRLGLTDVVGPDDFCVHDEYVGGDYAAATPGALEAIRLAARAEGLFLDPVYTGRAMAALIGEVRRGHIGPDETVVFVHTGGMPIIFAYADALKAL